jgi:hypothetical protein
MCVQCCFFKKYVIIFTSFMNPFMVNLVLFLSCNHSIMWRHLYSFLELSVSEIVEGAVVEALRSISSTFYPRIFRTKFWRQKLKAETFGFETFWWKDIGVQRTRKMLMKLTPGGRSEAVGRRPSTSRTSPLLQSTVKVGQNELIIWFGWFRTFFVILFPSCTEQNPVMRNKKI